STPYSLSCYVFFIKSPTTDIYTLSLHDALPISFLAQQGGALDFVMRSCSADVQLAASFANVVQVLQRAQVYQMLGHGKPQLHHGDEAHAAGERLGPAREQMQSFIERFRSGVFKFLSDHVGGSSQ